MLLQLSSSHLKHYLLLTETVSITVSEVAKLPAHHSQSQYPVLSFSYCLHHLKISLVVYYLCSLLEVKLQEDTDPVLCDVSNTVQANDQQVFVDLMERIIYFLYILGFLIKYCLYKGFLD